MKKRRDSTGVSVEERYEGVGMTTNALNEKQQHVVPIVVPVLIVTSCHGVVDQLLTNYISNRSLIKKDDNDAANEAPAAHPRGGNNLLFGEQRNQGLCYYKRKNKRVTEWLVEDEINKDRVVFSIVHTGLKHAISLRQMLYKQAIEKRSIILFVFSYTQSNSIEHISHTFLRELEEMSNLCRASIVDSGYHLNNHYMLAAHAELLKLSKQQMHMFRSKLKDLNSPLVENRLCVEFDTKLSINIPELFTEIYHMHHRTSKTNSPKTPPSHLHLYDFESYNPLIPTLEPKQHKLQLNKIFGAKLFKKKNKQEDENYEANILPPNQEQVQVLNAPHQHLTTTLSTSPSHKKTSPSATSNFHIRVIPDHYMMKDKSKKTKTPKNKHTVAMTGSDDRDIQSDSIIHKSNQHKICSMNRICSDDDWGNGDDLDPTENDLQTTCVSEFSEENSDSNTSDRRFSQRAYYAPRILTLPIEDSTDDGSSDMFDPDSLIDDEFTFRSTTGQNFVFLHSDVNTPDFDRELDQLDSIRWNLNGGDASLTVKSSLSTRAAMSNASETVTE
ncbi:hypothetical protein AKO1_011542 [Acrasis kona]|uniref:Uncharacterized protein n=1 Tax=Acrasis kona TaxID=1008807 RepID=A0AAW2Z3N0_9EUKA